MKQIDTTFESFFYQRPYTLSSFNFYLQVLAQQEKPDQSMKAFERMLALKLRPTDETFNHLMLAHAKLKMVDKVIEINKMAEE